MSIRELTANDFTWKIEYGLKEIIALERHTKMSMAEIGEKLQAAPSLELLTAVVWASLLKHQGEMFPFESTETMIVGVGMSAAVEASSAALAEKTEQLFAPRDDAAAQRNDEMIARQAAGAFPEIEAAANASIAARRARRSQAAAGA